MNGTETDWALCIFAAASNTLGIFCLLRTACVVRWIHRILLLQVLLLLLLVLLLSSTLSLTLIYQPHHICRLVSSANTEAHRWFAFPARRRFLFKSANASVRAPTADMGIACSVWWLGARLHKRKCYYGCIYIRWKNAMQCNARCGGSGGKPRCVTNHV